MHDSHQLASKAGSIAADYEGSAYGCAHCTLAGVQEALGIRDAVLLRAATGLSAESGLSADGTCGAYNGAVLAMSSVFGPDDTRADTGDAAAYRGFDLARRLFNRFMDRYGTLRCNAIRRRTDVYRSPAPDEDNLRPRYDRSTHCRETCRYAASWATELLLAEAARSGSTLADVRRDFADSRAGA